MTVLALLHTFFGYGVALSMARTFGLDVAEVLRGPSDYLALSYVVVVSFFNAVAEQTDVERVMFTLYIWGVTALAATLVLLMADGETAAEGFISTVGRRMEAAAHRIKRAPWPWRIPAAVGSLFAVKAVSLLLPLVMMAVVACMVVPFWFGERAASLFFYRTVTGPDHCAPLINAQQHRNAADAARQEQASVQTRKPEPGQPYVATCLEVRTPKLGVHRGRRVIATGDVVALYDADSGQVVIVSRKDAIVSLIERY